MKLKIKDYSKNCAIRNRAVIAGKVEGLFEPSDRVKLLVWDVGVIRMIKSPTGALFKNKNFKVEDEHLLERDEIYELTYNDREIMEFTKIN